MSSLGAEARGLVRTALNDMRTDLPDPLRYHLTQRFQHLAKRRFQKGKRLSEGEIAGLRREIDSLKLPNAKNIRLSDAFENKRLLIYAEPSLRELSSLTENWRQYTDDCLSIRALDTDLSRRRLEMLDWSLGVTFSGHALGRLFERQGSRVDLIPDTFKFTLESLRYVFALLYYLDTPHFAFPFADGLALGHVVRLEDSREELFAYAADIEGRGLIDTADIFHIGRKIDCDYCFRITTFISNDMLKPGQERLRNAMVDAFDSNPACVTLIAQGLYRILYPPNPAEPGMQALEASIINIKKSLDWSDTCGRNFGII